MKLPFRSLMTCVLGACALPVLTASMAPQIASAAAAPTRQQVVNEAMKFLGYKYSWDGDSPKTGFSCIGLVSYVFRELGVDMPGNLPDAKAAYPAIKERDLLPGDIIFFHDTWAKGLSHVALYIGGGEVIHAENPETGVVTSYLRNDPLVGNYFQQHYLVAERPLAGEVPVTHGKHKQSATVDVASLNLRASHSLEASVETVLTKGAVLGVFGHWGSWLKVETSSAVTGWVIKGGVAVTSSAGTSGSGSGHSGSGTQSGAGAGHAYPVTSGVNIHDGPALKDAVIAVTTAGMTVTVRKQKHGFARIQTPNDVVGWVLAKFVDGLPAASSGSSSGSKSKGRHSGSGKKGHKGHKTGTVTSTAHLRTGPSLNDTIIEWVEAGTKVTILGSSPQWDHVRINARLSGYVYSEFVKG